MRVALVHYWLLGSRGGERVLEGICRAFPQADIFTLFYDPEKVSPLIRSKNVHASFLNPLRRFHRAALPLAPLALESFDLRSYDLVISSESGPAKGVLTSSATRHVCYCHTPMRYLWEMYAAYRNDFGQGPLRRALMAPFANYLRIWDAATALRVDAFLANSQNVRRRIWKTYRRKARVVYPPVAVQTFYTAPSADYCLMVSELVSYKRLDYAVRLFARSGRKLKVAGDGPEYKSLKRLAGNRVEFCGRVSEPDLRELYARCGAFLMPGEEDFGMTMVEALGQRQARDRPGTRRGFGNRGPRLRCAVRRADRGLSRRSAAPLRSRAAGIRSLLSAGACRRLFGIRIRTRIFAFTRRVLGQIALLA